MAKRGPKPTAGDTGVFRVAKDLYLMISWIADAKGMTTSQVADEYLRQQIASTYLLLLPEIKKRKVLADERAAKTGVPASPLPPIMVWPPIPLREKLSYMTNSGCWAHNIPDSEYQKILEYTKPHAPPFTTHAYAFYDETKGDYDHELSSLPVVGTGGSDNIHHSRYNEFGGQATGGQPDLPDTNASGNAAQPEVIGGSAAGEKTKIKAGRKKPKKK